MMTLDAMTLDACAKDSVDQLADQVQRLLYGRIRDFRLEFVEEGLVLLGQAPTYYTKQLAQQTVMRLSRIRILANDIEVI